MKKELKYAVGLICFTGLFTPAFADFNSPPPSTVAVDNPPVVIPGPTSPGPVVVDNGSAPPSTTALPARHHKHHSRSSLSVSINMPAEAVPAATYYNSPRQVNYYRPRHPVWVASHSGDPLPPNAVIGGSRFNPNAMFYVCRAHYRGGIHPGKYSSGNCQISFSGRAVILQNYEVLVSRLPLTWVESSNGGIPHHAIAGGRSSKGATYYICQADFENGTYPGKLTGENCHFTKRGQEYMTAYYNVLVG